MVYLLRYVWTMESLFIYNMKTVLVLFLRLNISAMAV
jgi:hypothetical protein